MVTRRAEERTLRKYLKEAEKSPDEVLGLGRVFTSRSLTSSQTLGQGRRPGRSVVLLCAYFPLCCLEQIEIHQ